MNENKDNESLKNTFKNLDILNHFDYKPKYLSESDSQELENSSPLQSPTHNNQKIDENGNLEIKEEEKENNFNEGEKEERKEDFENIDKKDNDIDENNKEIVPAQPEIMDLGLNKELAEVFKDVCEIKYV